MKPATALTDGIHREHFDCEYARMRPERSAQKWIAWAPLVTLPIVPLAFRSSVTPWALMWLLALTIFAGCKWQTWWSAFAMAQRVPDWRRSAAYLLLWPGMDPKPFFEPVRDRGCVRPYEWLAALTKLILGVTFVAVSKSTLLTGHSLTAGWVGMIGLILILHFGALHLVALGWQRFGISVQPIMNRPLASISLSDLWGKRWNRGFRTLVHKLIFRPVQRHYGPVAATLATFLASGLIHDFVISVPARAGYGLPTAYFLIQGFGVIVERSRIGAALGLGNGLRGRVWFAFIAATPLPLLFHAWFMMRVMLPFLHAI